MRSTMGQGVSTVYTGTITITNVPVTGNSITINGNTRRWTNDTPASAASWIRTTNSVNASKTNLYAQIAVTPFIVPVFLTLTDAGADAFSLRGSQLSMSIVGNWASLTIVTQSGLTISAIQYPSSAFPNPAIATNQANALVDTIGRYVTTNAFATNAQALTNYVSKGAAPVQTILSPLFANNLSGNLSNLTGGVIHAVALSNSVAHLTGGYASNFVLVDPKLTNAINYGDAFRSPGPGIGSEQFGLGADATNTAAVAVGQSSLAGGVGSTAVGFFANAYGGLGGSAFGFQAFSVGDSNTAVGALSQALGTNSSAFGFSAMASHRHATAIGSGATTTETNQVRLGAADSSVSVPGVLRVTGRQESTRFTGSNRLDGMWSFTVTNIATLANGNNTLTPGSANFIRLSGGPSAAFSINSIAGGFAGRQLIVLNDTARELTIAHQSGFDATAANRIVVANEGSDLVIGTNGIAFFFYSADASRWLLGPNTVGAGGSGSISGGVGTNLFVDTSQFVLVGGTALVAKASLLLTNIMHEGILQLNGRVDNIQEGSAPIFYAAQYGGSGQPSYDTVRAEGTIASPTALSDGQSIGNFRMQGQADTAALVAFQIRPLAVGNWSDTQTETLVPFMIGASNSGVPVTVFTMRSFANTNHNDLYVGSNLTTRGLIRLSDADASHVVGLRAAPTTTIAWTNNLWSTNALTGQLLASDGTQLYWTPPPTGGTGSGETNFLGDAGLTNATRFTLVASKVGVTNYLKTISGPLSVIDQGTNLFVSPNLVYLNLGGGLGIGQASGGQVNFNTVAAAGGLAWHSNANLLTLSNAIPVGAAAIAANNGVGTNTTIYTMLTVNGLTTNIGDVRIDGDMSLIRDATAPDIRLAQYGGSGQPSLVLMRSGGTMASPSVTTDGQSLGNLRMDGRGDTADYTGLQIRPIAVGTWSDSHVEALVPFLVGSSNTPFPVMAFTMRSFANTNHNHLYINSNAVLRSQLVFQDSDASHVAVLRASATTTINWTNSLPTTNALTGQVLSSDGSQWYWAPASTGGVAFAGLSISNVVVLATNGDDATAQRGRLDLPFKNLTNALAVLQSGDTFLIGPGRHPAPGRVGTTNSLDDILMAPVRMTNLHNVSVIGLGQPTLWQTNQGNFFFLMNCRDILLQGIRFEGTPTNIPAGGINPILRAEGMLTFWGTNVGITIDGCSFTNHMNFGILDHGRIGAMSHNVTVRDCHFDQLGVTNLTSSGNLDGSAVNIGGNHWRIINNRIRNCVRGIEIFHNDLPIRDIQIRGNILISNYQRDIFAIAPINAADVQIVGNYIEGGPMQSVDKRGIEFQRGERVLIQGNFITNIFAEDFPIRVRGVVNDVSVLDNYIISCFQGIEVNSDNAVRNVRVAGNHLRNINGTGIYGGALENLTIENNLIHNVATTAAGSGIRLINFNPGTNAIIRHNVIADLGTPTTDTAITIDSGVRNTEIYGNRIANTSGGISDSGTATRINEWTLNRDGTATVRVLSGTGSPEGVVTAGIGSIYARLDGGYGTATYAKTNGTGSTGWAPVFTDGVGVGGSGSGETNFAGEASVTNASRFGLVHSKVGVTNLFRSVSSSASISIENQGNNLNFVLPVGLGLTNPVISSVSGQFDQDNLKIALRTGYVADALSVVGTNSPTEVFLIRSNATVWNPMGIETKEVVWFTNTLAFGTPVTVVDMSTNSLQVVTLTGNTGIITTNRTARSGVVAKSVRFIASGGDRIVTNNPAHRAMGTTNSWFTVPSGKSARLNLLMYDTTEAAIEADYLIQSN